MARKMAAALALVVFAVCVIAGLSAGNSFEAVVTRALLAMGAAFGVGMVIGVMAQKMIDENLAGEAAKLAAADAANLPPAGGNGGGSAGVKEKLRNPERNSGPRGR